MEVKTVSPKYSDKVKAYRRNLDSQAYVLQRLGDTLAQVAEDVATNPDAGNLRNLAGISKAAIDAWSAANDRQKELLELDWVIERVQQLEEAQKNAP